MLKVVAICTVYNRFRCAQRVLRSFLEQNYQGQHTLLIFNSGAPLELLPLELSEFKNVILINQTIDSRTHLPYISVGDKYNDALKYVHEDVDVICSMDSDDIFLPNYISDGVKGMNKAYEGQQLAFKPYFSFFKYMGNITLEHNVFEPSIFVDVQHVRNTGYFSNSVHYHSKWLQPLIDENKILVDKSIGAGFCYDWGGEIPVYKLSGRGVDNQENFEASQNTEQDRGQGTLFPTSQEEMWRYYNEIYDFVAPIKNN